MEITLLDLPQVCLEEIFGKLPFAEISRLGATCTYFREISKTIFRLHFKNIEDVIEKEMVKIETEVSKAEKLTIPEHLHLALLHSVLRIVYSEVKMLKAHCWRYMRDDNYDFCFPAGVILDEFQRILLCVKNRTLKKDMEPEITTTLFHLGETFYDYFDYHIENYFQTPTGLEVKITSETNRRTFLPNIYNFVSNLTRETLLRDIHRFMKKQKHRSRDYQTTIHDKMYPSNNKQVKCTDSDDRMNGSLEKTLFGVKILDILNCCASTDCHTFLQHNHKNEGFRLKTNYELRDINVLEALPTIGLPMSNSEKQLNKICRYIRNNVRWTNLFHPLQDLWMLEDAIEINRNAITVSALLGQFKLHRTSSRLKFNNLTNDLFQYDYKKVMSRFKNRFGLSINATLECPTLHHVPLKIDKCLGSREFMNETVHEPEWYQDYQGPIDECNNITAVEPTDVDKEKLKLLERQYLKLTKWVRKQLCPLMGMMYKNQLHAEERTHTIPFDRLIIETVGEKDSSGVKKEKASGRRRDHLDGNRSGRTTTTGSRNHRLIPSLMPRLKQKYGDIHSPPTQFPRFTDASEATSTE